MVTYRLSMVLKDDAASLYTIFGTQDSPMIVPPAMQIGAPFGAHIGGVNPVLIAVQPSAAADSWLSVGITDGDSTGALSAIGIDFLSWTATSGITVDEGAIFWLSPADAPGGSVTVAQLTIPAGDSFDLVLNAQGRSLGARTIDASGAIVGDWQLNGVHFMLGSAAVAPLPPMCAPDDENCIETVSPTCGEYSVTYDGPQGSTYPSTTLALP